MSPPGRVLVSFIAFVLGAPALPAAADDAPRIVGDPAIADLALAAVDAYHRLDREFLGARLGEVFRFVEERRGPDRKLDAPGFLDMLPTIGTDYADRELDVEWVGVIPSDDSAGATVDVRGRWRATEAASGRALEKELSIRLGLEAEGKIASWTQVFADWLPMPVRGDGRYLSEHFDVRYLSAEFDAEAAARLASLAEKWYERTAAYLGRSFESGRRVLLDVASVHGSPYASAPGPDAFFLVSVKSARMDYGFSLVHELTHNLMGHSRLMESSHGEDRDGNRLLDEGFGVYVEEKLVENGRVYPNFGQEIHHAYLDLDRRMDVPRPPILEAEGLRNAGGDKRRLGYLQQASFVKWLVDTAPGPDADDGLDRFLELFEQGIDAAPRLYGRDLAQLEKEWRAFLDKLSETTGDQSRASGS